MLGVTARNAIEAGLIAGPRMRAGSPEVTTTAGLGDERKRYIHQESFGLIADGPDEMRRVARESVRDGVDVMKSTFPVTNSSRMRAPKSPRQKT